MQPSWDWFFWRHHFPSSLQDTNLWNHLVLIVFEAKEMEWKPLLDTDWATWVYDYGSVSPCYLLAERLGASCLTSLRFSVPGYNSTPLLCCWRLNDTIPIKHWASPWQVVRAGCRLPSSLPLHLIPGPMVTPSDWRKKWLILEGERWVRIHPEIGQRYIIPNGLFSEEVTWVFE